MVESFTDKRPTHCAITSTFFGDSVRSRFRRETGSASKLFKYPPFRFLLPCDSLMFSFHAKPMRLPESSYQLRGVRRVFSPSYRNTQLNALSSKVGDCGENQLDGLIESSLCDSFSLQTRRESRYNRKFPLSNLRLPKMRKQKLFRAQVRSAIQIAFVIDLFLALELELFCSRFCTFLIHFIFQLRSHLRHVNRMLHLHKLLRVERKKPSRRRKIHKNSGAKMFEGKPEKRNRIRSLYTPSGPGQ